jgi:hypothetical protein
MYLLLVFDKKAIVFEESDWRRQAVLLECCIHPHLPYGEFPPRNKGALPIAPACAFDGFILPDPVGLLFNSFDISLGEHPPPSPIPA